MFTIITNYKKLFLLTLRSEFVAGGNAERAYDSLPEQNKKNIRETDIDNELEKMKRKGFIDMRDYDKLKERYMQEKLEASANHKINKLLKDIEKKIYNDAKAFYKGKSSNEIIKIKNKLNIGLKPSVKKLDLNEKIDNEFISYVIGFQRKQNIKVDGKFGGETEKKYDEIQQTEKKSTDEKVLDTAPVVETVTSGITIDTINNTLSTIGYKSIDGKELNQDDLTKINKLINKIQLGKAGRIDVSGLEKELSEKLLSKGITLLKDSQELEEVQVSETKSEKVAPAPLETAKLSPEQAEKSYNERLDKALDPKTHIFLDLGDGKVLVMEGNNEVKEGILRLIKSMDNDKYAVYSVLKLISLNKKNIKTVSDIYKDFDKELLGSQLIIKKGDSVDKALLNSHFKDQNIETINIEKGSKLLNVLGNVGTLGLFDIDTANIGSGKIKKGTNGRKAETKDIYDGYVSGKENIKPLSRFEKGKILDNYSIKIKEILSNRKAYNEAKDTPIGKLAKKYIDYIGQNSEEKFFISKDKEGEKLNSINDWLKSQEKDLFPQKEGVTISENGFITFDIEAIGESKDNDYIKVGLKGVEGEDKNGKKIKENKDVYMEKGFVSFKELGIKFDEKKPFSVDYQPIFLEKAGVMMQITKDGVYVIGEGLSKGKNKTIDFVKDNDVIVAGLLGGIVGACIVNGINIPKINFSWLKLDLPEVHVSAKSAGKEFRRFIDKIEPTRLGKIGIIGYIATAIPLQWQIEGLEERLAKTLSNYEGGKALDYEVEGMMKVNLDKDISKLNNEITDEKPSEERINGIIHKILIAKKIFKIGEVTGLTFDCEKNGNEYTIKAQGKGEKGSNFIKNGKEYYIPENSELKIYFNKDFNVTVMSGKVKQITSAVQFDKELDISDVIKS